MNRCRWMMPLLGILLLSAAAHGSSDASFVTPPREIFPIPRIAAYQQGEVDLSSGIALTASDKAAPMARLAQEDTVTYLSARYDHPFHWSKSGLTVHALLAGEETKDLSARLYDSTFNWRKLPDDPRHEQAYLIRSFLTDGDGEVYVVGQSPQGLYYGLMAVTQLIQFDNGHFSLRGADVVDWPAFSQRMAVLSMLSGYYQDAQGATDALRRMLLVRKAAFGRQTGGVTGYVAQDADFARRRGLYLGDGYYQSIYFDPSKIDPTLKRYNWSDPRVLKGWADLAKKTVKDEEGAFFWHDATDAGWWNKYVEQFWHQRDAVDRANYPTDEGLAQADSRRFAAITAAIRALKPDYPIYYTLPCYYDDPHNDKLPRIDLFRAYLKQVGASVPSNVCFILEQRTPDEVRAYAKYLDRPILCYIYGGHEPDHVWTTEFTKIGKYVGTCDAFLWGISGIPQDLTATTGSQYMWNPSVPITRNWVERNLLPRTSQLMFGPAWRQMAQFALIDVDFDRVTRETQPAELRASLASYKKADDLLAEAARLIPASWLDPRWIISSTRKHLAKSQAIARKALKEVESQIDLTKAVFTPDSTGAGAAQSLATPNGLWQSAATPMPHALEIRLPRVYAVNALAITHPEEGYELLDFDFQAWWAGTWVTLLHDCGRRGKWRASFDPIRTDRLRLVVRKAEDYNSLRNDLSLSCLQLYGQPAQADPRGMLSLDGAWQFRIDPKAQGMAAKWFAPQLDRSQWEKIRVPGYWEGSGASGTSAYDGLAWYARSFNVPPQWKKFAIQVRFEAVDDEATVWVNGQLAGQHLHQKQSHDWFREPFAFDVTRLLKWGQPNEIVVQVNDQGLGGGIWKPVWLEWAEGPGKVQQGQ